MNSSPPSRSDLPAGLGVAAFGCFTLFMILSDDGSSQHAPLWVALTAGGSFVLAGLAMAARAGWNGPSRVLWESVSTALTGLIVSSLGLIGAWVAFGSGERRSGASTNVPFFDLLSPDLFEKIFRGVFGFGALITLAMAAAIWVKLSRILLNGSKEQLKR